MSINNDQSLKSIVDNNNKVEDKLILTIMNEQLPFAHLPIKRDENSRNLNKLQELDKFHQTPDSSIKPIEPLNEQTSIGESEFYN